MQLREKHPRKKDLTGKWWLRKRGRENGGADVGIVCSIGIHQYSLLIDCRSGFGLSKWRRMACVGTMATEAPNLSVLVQIG